MTEMRFILLTAIGGIYTIKISIYLNIITQ